jgi:hypothetical protein
LKLDCEILNEEIIKSLDKNDIIGLEYFVLKGFEVDEKYKSIHAFGFLWLSKLASRVMIRMETLAS